METVILRKPKVFEDKCSSMYMTIEARSTFRFSKTAEEKLNLSSETRVTFFENDELEGDWFMKLSDDGEFGLKRQWNGYGTSSWLQFHSKGMRNEVMESLGIERGTINLRIKEKRESMDGEIYYRLEYVPKNL